ncbi:monooxygenase, partial [Pseudoxanthomonas sp. SGD-10]
VGAGIMLAGNAMQIYKHLGVADKIIQKGNPFDQMNITKPNLEILSHVDLTPIIEKQNTPNIAIHRASLHQILMEEVGPENVNVNKRLQHIVSSDQQYLLKFEDGTMHVADYLIGADGLNSKVRNLLFKKTTLRDSGQICWRGVTNYQIDNKLNNKFYEAWGKGKRFGYVVLSKQQIYWYLLIDDTMGTVDSKASDYVDGFFPLAKKLIEATDTNAIITAKLFDLKPTSQWDLPRVCLLGDAAHATTPNLGQGACQAIEDAYVLGKLMEKYTVDYAFKTYPEIRIKKAHSIVHTSWQTGKLAHLSNPLQIFLRDAIMKLTPEKLMLKRIEKMYALDAV